MLARSLAVTAAAVAVLATTPSVSTALPPMIGFPAATTSGAWVGTSVGDVTIQTVLDERARVATGRAKVLAPSLEDLGLDVRSNKTEVTKVGRTRVIASRRLGNLHRPFSLKPGRYRFTTTITYGSPTASDSATKSISRRQTVRVLKPTVGTCIYMVKNGETLGAGGDRFMVWHKVGKKVHGITGAFYSEYADLRLRFNTSNTRASGVVAGYPTGSLRATAYRLTGAGNATYRAKGWYRVSAAGWKAQIPWRSTPHCR